jgi:NADH-quinone oxidoreductase subunit H
VTALLAIDPLLNPAEWTWKILVIIVLKVVAVFTIGLVATILVIWFERKVVAGMHNRFGPNKAGPFGILQTLADGMKLMFKEGFWPDKADKPVYLIAPFLAFVPAFCVWAVIPLGGDFTERADGTFRDGTVAWGDYVTRVQLIDPPIGILVVLALSGIAVYGIMLAGWSSGSKYPLLGSVRATAQMISYEAALGLSLAAVLLFSGTLSTSGIVAGQNELLDWNIVATGFVPFVIFLIAMTAELNRPPFDLVEAEQELVAGFNTEYSSFHFALFYVAEFMNLVSMSGVIVTVFLGGPQPLHIGDVDIFGWADPVGGTLWLFVKVMCFLYLYVWIRATLPRPRYDQLMDLGWKLLIPVALGWFLVLAALQLGRDEDWNLAAVVAVALGGLLLAYLLFTAALSVARKNREAQGAVY